jgi:hypothetical protein
MKLKEVGCQSMEWIHLAWDRDKWWYTPDSMKDGKFILHFFFGDGVFLLS